MFCVLVELVVLRFKVIIRVVDENVFFSCMVVVFKSCFRIGWVC